MFCKTIILLVSPDFLLNLPIPRLYPRFVSGFMLKYTDMTEIKNLEKVAKRILKAIKKKEKIILYGDSDLDGTVSVILLEETIKNLGGKVFEIYFPDREKEGYGLNEQALSYLKPKAPALLITLDCGISNFKEIKKAKRMGFEVIVVDHHEVLGKVPSASIVADPKQKGDKYLSKELANAGIVYRLTKILLKRKLDGLLNNSFLELVALATLADMMPPIEENKILIAEGLLVLNKTMRPGLKIFWKMDSIEKSSSIRMMASKIISVFNTTESENHLTESYLLLNISDEKKAEKIVKDLIKKSEEKHEKLGEITWEVQERVLKDIKSLLVFEGDENWPLAFAGAVASRICRDFQKPVFIFRKDETKSRGAVRTPKGLDSVKAMKSCSYLLETFGGHPLAAGFTIKNENLDKFKKCLIKYFKNKKK